MEAVGSLLPSPQLMVALKVSLVWPLGLSKPGSVKVAGETVKLTPTEYGLLRLFVQHAGRILTHGQILREVWGPNTDGETNYLRVYITGLRKKLEENPQMPQLIITEPGVGYRLRILPA